MTDLIKQLKDDIEFYDDDNISMEVKLCDICKESNFIKRVQELILIIEGEKND